MRTGPTRITDSQARALRTFRDLGTIQLHEYLAAMYPDQVQARDSESHFFHDPEWEHTGSRRTRKSFFVVAALRSLDIMERNGWIGRRGSGNELSYYLTTKGRRRIALYDLAEETASMGAELFRKRLMDMNAANRSLVGGTRTAGAVTMKRKHSDELDDYRMDRPDE